VWRDLFLIGLRQLACGSKRAGFRATKGTRPATVHYGELPDTTRTRTPPTETRNLNLVLLV